VKLGKCLAEQLGDLLPTFVTTQNNRGEGHSVDLPKVVYASSCGVKKAGLFLEVPRGCAVAMRTQGVVSPLGEIIAHDTSFEPTHNVFERPGEQEGEVQRVILVDCPGVRPQDYLVQESVNGAKVEIRKERVIDESRVTPIYPVRQSHGRWEKEFDFPSRDGRFEIVADGVQLTQGMLRVVLRRRTSTQTWGQSGFAAAISPAASTEGQYYNEESSERSANLTSVPLGPATPQEDQSAPASSVANAPGELNSDLDDGASSVTSFAGAISHAAATTASRQAETSSIADSGMALADQHSVTASSFMILPDGASAGSGAEAPLGEEGSD